MSYLARQDASKKPTGEKINDAVCAYIDRYDALPVECLMNAAEFAALGDEWKTGELAIKPASFLGPGLYYVGHPDPAEEVSLR
jgi:hypothetical protein